ncbi:TPM domain-containing protein [Tsukamurella ocularis]|uniref:TPM domain-containing protein n=1 Tax=Tsukamurella ocularis TaxID=1970234 RepID=UPI002166E6DB|nr:TPM domain-containing protein [Tsukamurella ocularis]MCS3779500.1 putative membrane protein YgcG [Tsukamurella ocularis]MCS3788027.1 putative membrane protein YgcG [Tsukamurella ocularis]MCS3852343.1 putative membrane protein YgcG [Tsukamurella ocularis]
MNRIFGMVCALIVALCVGAGPASADPAGVVDRAGLFGSRTVDVQAALDDFQVRTGMVGTVVTANGIGGQDIRAFATTAGAVLGRDRGEAIVIGVDLQTRKVGVYTTPTAMARIPDTDITHVIDTAITPPFRAADYANGVIAGLRALTDVASGVAQTTAPTTTVEETTAPGLGGSTVTVYPGNGLGGFPGNYRTYPSVTWPETPKQSGPGFGVFVVFVIVLAAVAVIGMVASGLRSASADTPELRRRLADLVEGEPGYASWSNRRRYEHARRQTGVPLGTWNTIYPQWHVRDTGSSSSSSAGGFFGGGGSSSSFSSGGSGSDSGSSSSSGGFSGGGGSSGSF